MRFLFKPKLVYFVAFNIVISICCCRSAPAQKKMDGAGPILWKVKPFYMNRSDGKPGRAMKILVKDYKGPIDVKVVCNSITETTKFNQNDTSNYLLLPAG